MNIVIPININIVTIISSVISRTSGHDYHISICSFRDIDVGKVLVSTKYEVTPSPKISLNQNTIELLQPFKRMMDKSNTHIGISNRIQNIMRLIFADHQLSIVIYPSLTISISSTHKRRIYSYDS